MAAYLQTLKETFADPAEALRIRWIDVNESNNTISINYPVKGHNPPQLQVSTKLIAMLNALPKTSETIFPTTYRTMVTGSMKVRARAAQKLQNPRLRSITFTTFRHWGATMTYQYNRKILLVKKLLGHKNIQSTMVYTQLVQFKDDEFDVETATTVEEAKTLSKQVSTISLRRMASCSSGDPKSSQNWGLQMKPNIAGYKRKLEVKKVTC